MALLALSPPFIRAQPLSRSQEIEQERDKKAALLKPETIIKEEGFLRDFKDKGYLNRLTTPRNGLRAKTGNLVTGSGFAIGPCR